MKIRTLTLGISVSKLDFLDSGAEIVRKISQAAQFLNASKSKLICDGYEVQTIRLTTNNFCEWIDEDNMIGNIELLNEQLAFNDISFCSIGGCSDTHHIAVLPRLLQVSNRIYACVLFEKSAGNPFAPPLSTCLSTASALLEISRNIKDRIGSFHFCAAFNCPPNIPFFPASYHETDCPSSKLTVGLENGDLLFLAFTGVDDANTARENLIITLRQVLTPLDAILRELCESSHSIEYGGIDPSLCPGLTLLPVDSVGAGLELLHPDRPFGSLGTLSAVSCVTSALKSLRAEGSLSITGYCGLMLPVMEDTLLATRAAQSPPSFGVRDLLLFSSVCGVGLDTVPVSGDVTVEDIAGAYMETGVLACRLDKPLSCRLIPFLGKKEGEAISDEDLATLCNPYLRGTRVFTMSQKMNNV